ncbi:COQ5 protein, partial [Polypterus senegalus]
MVRCERISQEESEGQVFANVAEKYDVMNDAMSLGIHRLWKDSLLHKMNPTPGTLLLDVAGGTGDISFRFLEYVRFQLKQRTKQDVRSQQTPSWNAIAESYSSGHQNSNTVSQAIVCDINKAMLYDAYSFQMIPVLGEVIAGDWKSYQYLVESIRCFPDQPQPGHRLQHHQQPTENERGSREWWAGSETPYPPSPPTRSIQPVSSQEQ